MITIRYKIPTFSSEETFIEEGSKKFRPEIKMLGIFQLRSPLKNVNRNGCGGDSAPFLECVDRIRFPLQHTGAPC